MKKRLTILIMLIAALWNGGAMMRAQQPFGGSQDVQAYTPYRSTIYAPGATGVSEAPESAFPYGNNGGSANAPAGPHRLGGMGAGGVDGDDIGQQGGSPVGAPWILLLFAMAYIGWRVVKTKNQLTTNLENQTTNDIMKTNFSVQSACDSFRQSPDGRPTVGRQSSVNQMTTVSQPSAGRLSFTNALRNLCVSFAHRSRLVATLLLLVTMSIGQVWADKTIYLNTGGASLWNKDGATFWVHAWGSCGTDKKMTLVEGDIYSVDICDGANSIIFLREKPDASSVVWNNNDGMWNKTGDLSIPNDKNCFTMTGWDTGSWSTYSPVVPETKYAVTISAGIGGSVSPSGSQQIGTTSVTLTATPELGYVVDQWTATGGARVVGSGNSVTATASEVGTISVTFKSVFADIAPTNVIGYQIHLWGSSGTDYKLYHTNYDGYYATKLADPLDMSTLTGFGFKESNGAWVGGNGKTVGVLNAWVGDVYGGNNGSLSLSGMVDVIYFYKGSTNAVLFHEANVVSYTVNVNDGAHGTVSPNGAQTVGAAGLDLSVSPATGYNHTGWNVTDGVTVTDNHLTATADGTATATYTPISYSITYANMDGATNYDGAPANYTIESATIVLGSPTKDGFTFFGWKLTNAEGESVTQIETGSTGNVTLWATWDEVCVPSSFALYNDNDKYQGAEKPKIADFVATGTPGQYSLEFELTNDIINGLYVMDNCGKKYGCSTAIHPGETITLTTASSTFNFETAAQDKHWEFTFNSTTKELTSGSKTVEEQTHTITVVGAENCTVTGKADSYREGAAVSFTIAPNSGYSITNVVISPVGLSVNEADGVYTISGTMPTANVTVTVTEGEDLHTGWYLNGDSPMTWDKSASMEFIKESGASTVGYVSVTLTAGTYNIQLRDNSDNQWTNDNKGTMTRVNCTNWPFSTVGGYEQNSHITADIAGTYRFAFDTDTKTLSVIYPGSGCTTPTIAWATAPTGGEEGEHMTATVTKNYAGATVTWESSNTAVATVNSEGVITYKSAGTATITASYTGGDEYCEILASVNRDITVTPSSHLYVYLGSQITLSAGEWVSNYKDIVIADGKLTANALGDYDVTRDASVVHVHVYQYYIKHPWNTSGDGSKWVWKAMTIKNGTPTYTGVAGGNNGANIGWSTADMDGSIGDITGSNWISHVEPTNKDLVLGKSYNFIYEPGQALNGASSPVNTGTLRVEEVVVETTTITFGIKTVNADDETIAGPGGNVTSTAGESGSAVVRETNVTFTAAAEDGYNFVGWYSDADCTNKLGTETTYTATMTGETFAIYAKFQQKRQVTAAWYLIGNSLGDDWSHTYTNNPMDKAYREMTNMYYRKVTFATGTQYFRVHNGSSQFGFSDDNKWIQVGYQRAIAMENIDDVGDRRNFKHGAGNTIIVVLDGRDAAHPKMWYEYEEMTTLYNVNVTNGAEGTYTLAVNSGANVGLETTKFAGDEKYLLTITPNSAEKEPEVTVDGNKVSVVLTNEGTYTYKGEIGNADHAINITYVDKKPLTVNLHVECDSWKTKSIYARYQVGENWETSPAMSPMGGYADWYTITYPKTYQGGKIQFTTDAASDNKEDWSGQVTIAPTDESFCYKVEQDKNGYGEYKLSPTDCPAFTIKLIVANGDEIGSTATLTSQANVTGDVTKHYYYSKDGAAFVEIAEVAGAYTYNVVKAGTYKYKVVATYDGVTIEDISSEIVVKPATLKITPSTTAISTDDPVTLTPTIENIAAGTTVTLCFTVTKDGEASTLDVVENAGVYSISLTETGTYGIHAELKMGDDCDGDVIATAETEITRGTLSITLTPSNDAPVLDETITLTTKITGGSATNYRLTVKSSTEPMPKIIYNGTKNTKTFKIESVDTYDFTVTATIDGRNYTASCRVVAGAKDVYINYPWSGGAMPADTEKKLMTYTGDGVYTYYEEGQSKFQGGIEMDVLVGASDFKQGDKVTFTYNPSTDKLYIALGGDIASTITPTEHSPSDGGYYVKHPWNSGTWLYYGMKDNGDGTYSVSGVLGNDGGVNFRHYTDESNKKFTTMYTKKNSLGAYIYEPKRWVDNVTLIGLTVGEDEGEDAIFSYNSNRNELTIMAATTTLYRIKSDNGKNGTFYSNEVSADDPVSFYASPSSVLTMEKFDKNNTSAWVTVDDVANTVAEGNIYVADANVSSHTLSNVAVYTGDYYIYSHNTSLSEETIDQAPAAGKKSAKMTYFNNISDAEFYNHYWVEWITTGHDAYATVGNKINRNLSVILPSFTLSSGEGTNLRYGFNPNTNYFGRSFLKGSTDDSGAWFLQLFGSNVFGTDKTTVMNGTNRVNFEDGSNWVYTADLTGMKPAEMKLVANYGGSEYYLLSPVGDPSYTQVLLGATSTTGDEKLKFRVIYDYKFNRLVAGWIPEADTITDKRIVESDILFVRNENEGVAQLVMGNEEALISSLQQVMFVLEFDKKKGASGESNYWISLPFDCRISDIFGIAGYMDIWGIQRYDGKRRAEIGWFAETHTFWTWMGADEILKKGEGYVLTIDRSAAPWREIGGKSILRLFFPSIEKGFYMSQSTIEPPITYPNEECTIMTPEDRRAQDSNWKLIGPNGYTDIQISRFESQSDGEHHLPVQDAAPNFLYKFMGHDYAAQSGSEIGNYVVCNAQDPEFKYQAFFSYMVQFGGTINWTQYTKGENGVAAYFADAPRRAKADFSQTILTLDIYKGDNTRMDQTFIDLRKDATEGFDQNKDLTKMKSTKATQIYSVSEGEAYAGNALPLTTDTVALVVNVASTGDYTISMPSANNFVEPVLWDKETGIKTPLNMNEYLVLLEKGMYENRFYLILGEKVVDAPTSIDGVAVEDVNLPKDQTQKLLINGQLYLLRDGRLYDATGKRAE